jgi:hypothetical protein
MYVPDYFKYVNMKNVPYYSFSSPPSCAHKKAWPSLMPSQAWARPDLG